MSKLYTKDHEWVVLDGDVATIGISKYAVEQLGEIVAIDFADIGAPVETGKDFAVVHSTKTAGEVMAPFDGEVIENNTAIEDDWSLLDTDAEGAGWISKIKVAPGTDVSGLMNADEYAAYLDGK